MLLSTFIWLLYLIAISNSHIIPKSIDNDYNLNALINELNDFEELIDGNNVASYKTSKLETNIEKPKEYHEKKKTNKTTKLRTTEFRDSTNLSNIKTTTKKTHFWNRILTNFKKNHKKTTLLFQVRGIKPSQSFDSMSDYIYHDFPRPKRHLNKTKKIHCNRMNKLKSLKTIEAADVSSSDSMMIDLIGVTKTTTLNNNINKASDPDSEINFSSKVTTKTFKPTTSAKITKIEVSDIDTLISTEADDFNNQLSTIIDKYSTYSTEDTTENEYLGTMELEPILNRIKNDTIRFINKINPVATATDMYALTSATEVPEYALTTLITLTNGRPNNVLGIELANIITVSPVVQHTARSVDKQIEMEKNRVKSMYNKYYKKLSNDFKCEVKEMKATLSDIVKKLHKATKKKTVTTKKEHKKTSTPIKTTESPKAGLHQSISLNPVLHNVPCEKSNRPSRIERASNEQIDHDYLMLRSFERMLSKSPDSKLDLYETVRPARLSKRDNFNTSLPSEVLDYVEANKNNEDDNSKSEEFENLMKRLSYNEYVNGYRHFLKFERELGAENFSNAIKFQAHLHHKVDDIGKFILTKLPELPDSTESLDSTESPTRTKRLIANSIDQDVTSKTEDSWFKKYFSLFSETRSPKKFHTFQIVELKTPSNSAVDTAGTQMTPQKIVGDAGDAKVRDNDDKNLDLMTAWLYSLTSSSPDTNTASGTLKALKPKRSEQKQRTHSKRSINNVGNDRIPKTKLKGNTKTLHVNTRYPTEVVNLIKVKTSKRPNLYHRMLKKFRSGKHKKTKQNHTKHKRHAEMNPRFSPLKKLKEIFGGDEESTSDTKFINSKQLTTVINSYDNISSLRDIVHEVPNITQDVADPYDRLQIVQKSGINGEDIFLNTDKKYNMNKYPTQYGIQKHPNKSDISVKKYPLTSENPMEYPDQTGTSEATKWVPKLGLKYMFAPKVIDDTNTVSCKKCHNKRNVKDVTGNGGIKYLPELTSFITQRIVTESHAIVKPKTVTKLKETSKNVNLFKRIFKKLKINKKDKNKAISKRLAERNPRFNPIKMLKEMFGATEDMNRRNKSDNEFLVDERMDIMKSFKFHNLPSMRAMMQQIPNITQDITVPPVNQWQPSDSYEDDIPEMKEIETPEFRNQIHEMEEKKIPKYRIESYTLKSGKTPASEKLQWNPMETKPSPFFNDLDTRNSKFDISEKTPKKTEENKLVIPDKLSWKHDSNSKNKVTTFYDTMEKNLLNLENDLKKYPTKYEVAAEQDPLKFRNNFIKYPANAENLKKYNPPTKSPFHYYLVEMEDSLKKGPSNFEFAVPKKESIKETSDDSKTDYFGDVMILDNDVLSGNEKTDEEFMKILSDYFESGTPDKKGLEEEAKSIEKFVGSTTKIKTKGRTRNEYFRDYSKTSLVESVTSSSRKDKETSKKSVKNDQLDDSSKVVTRITASDQAMLMTPAKDDLHGSKTTQENHSHFGNEDDYILDTTLFSDEVASYFALVGKDENKEQSSYRQIPTREMQSVTEPALVNKAKHKVPLKSGFYGDDNFYAYDDTSFMNDKEDHKKKNSRSSQNLENKVKAKLLKQPQLKTNKINTRPEQFFSTPLPMKRPEFEKFLRENKMDVLSVTSPLPDLDKLTKTAKSMQHKPIKELKNKITEREKKVKGGSTPKSKGEGMGKGETETKHRRSSQDVTETNHTHELKKHEAKNHSNEKKNTVKKLNTNGKKQKTSPKKLKNKNVNKTAKENHFEKQKESVKVNNLNNRKILKTNKHPIHRNGLDYMQFDMKPKLIEFDHNQAQMIHYSEDSIPQIAVKKTKFDKNRHVTQTYLKKMHHRTQKLTTKEWPSLSRLQELLLSKKHAYNFDNGFEFHTLSTATPAIKFVKKPSNKTIWIKLVLCPQAKKRMPVRLMGLPRHNEILASEKPYPNQFSANDRHQRDNHKRVFSESQAETVEIRYGDGSNMGELKDNNSPVRSTIPSTVYYYTVKEPRDRRKLIRIFARSQRMPTLRFFQVPMKKPEKHTSQKWSRAGPEIDDDDGFSEDKTQLKFHISNENIEDLKLHDPGYYEGQPKMHHNPVFIEFIRKRKIPNKAAKSKGSFQVQYVASRDRRDTDVRRYQVEIVFDLVKLNDSHLALARPNENLTNVVVHLLLAVPLNDLDRCIQKIITAKPKNLLDIENNADSKWYHANNSDLYTPGMYVLMDNNDNGDLELRHIESSDALPTVVTTMNPQTKAKVKVTLSKEFISALNEQVSQIYGGFQIESTTAMINTRGYIDDIKRNIIDSLKEEIAKVNDRHTRGRMELKTKRSAKNNDTKTGRVWDSIKKYFGHEHVCRCKCKVNTTMCPMCAEIDNVMRELISEFDFISDYMKEHCTEIQTFFWQNPTGGKKLRNKVKNIDKNLNNYFKRVSGKCKGRVCDKFLSYPEKRSYKIEKYDPKILQMKLNNLSSHLKKAIHDRICLCKFINLKSNDLVEIIETFSHISKKPDMRSITQSQAVNPNDIYAVKKISFNIVSDKKARNTITKTSDSTEISTPKYTPLTGLDTYIDNIMSTYNLVSNKTYESAKISYGENSIVDKPLQSKSKLQNLKNAFLKMYQTRHSAKREVKEEDSQIEKPLISDAQGFFWSNYINKGRDDTVSNSNIIARQFDNIPDESLDEADDKMYARLVDPVPVAATESNNEVINTRSMLVLKDDHQKQFKSNNFSELLKALKENFENKIPVTSFLAKYLNVNTKQNKTTKKIYNEIHTTNTPYVFNFTIMVGHGMTSVVSTKDLSPTTQSTKSIHKPKTTTRQKTTKNIKKPTVITKTMTKSIFGNKTYTKITSNAMKTKLATNLSDKETHSKNTKVYDKDAVKKYNDNRLYKFYTILATYCHPRGQYIKQAEKYATKDHVDEISGSSSLSDLNHRENESLRDLEMKLEVMNKHNEKYKLQTLSMFEKANDLDNLMGGKEGHNTQDDTTKSVLANKDFGETKHGLGDTAKSSTMSMKPDYWWILRYLNSATSKHETTTPLSLLANVIIKLKRIARRKENSSKLIEKKAITLENKKDAENYNDVFKGKVFDATTMTNNSICDLQVTLEQIARIKTKMASRKFEKYARNVSCLKNKTVPEVFNIALDTSSKVQYPKMTWDWIRSKRSLLSIDDFDTFYRGRDGVYRWQINRRRKRTLDRKEMYEGFRNLPKIVDDATNVYAMSGDTVTFYCNPSTLFQKQPFMDWRRRSNPYIWTTDREDMPNYDNVKVNEDSLVLSNVTARNVGVYSCRKGLNLRRRVMLSVLSMPEFRFSFGLAYNAGSDCNYDHLKAFRSGLPDQMARHACAHGRLCTITIDDLVCLKDYETGNSTLRGTAFLTPAVTVDMDCSPLCRRDILCTLAVLSAENMPVLASIPVEMSDGVHKRTFPAVTSYNSNSIITHTLRRKNSRRQRDSRQMSAVKPGDMRATVCCPAGHYLQAALKICGVCPMNTFAGYGSNICSACLPGTRALEPGSAVCHYPANRKRRYDWISVSHGSYAAAAAAAACVCVLGAVCGACGACAARGGSKERREAAMTSVLTARHSPRPATRAARPSDPLSPSRVLLTKFFKGFDSRDSQETRLEVCKEENLPPPLPPVDFD